MSCRLLESELSSIRDPIGIPLPAETTVSIIMEPDGQNTSLSRVPGIVPLAFRKLSGQTLLPFPFTSLLVVFYGVEGEHSFVLHGNVLSVPPLA